METLQSMYTETAEELTGHILPFWNAMRDERGGYYGYVDFDLHVRKEAPRGAILNSRILWFYSSIYLFKKDPAVLSGARHAFEFLTSRFVDAENGGIYWMVDSTGEPADDEKHTYNQAFTIYGLSAYYEASGDRRALNLAYSLFHTIEAKCRDSYGYREAFSRTWEPVENDKLSEDGYSADKTMNTLLHVMEAYTELYRADGSPEVGAALRYTLGLCMDRVYNPEKRYLEVFFNSRMEPISDLYSYGHDIEASWLIDRACEALGDAALTSRIAPVTLSLAENVYRTAYEHSSLNNQCCRGAVDPTRIWWVQAESVVGFLNAWQKGGDPKFLDASLQIWGFIRHWMIDPRPGSEWYAAVDENGIPKRGLPIVEPWKCPYHNGRMCMEVQKRYASVYGKIPQGA